MADFNQISFLRTPVDSPSGAQTQKHANPSGSKKTGTVPVPLLLIVTALVGYGLVVVYAAVASNSDYSFSHQLVGIAMGIVVMLIVRMFDYRMLAGYTIMLLIVNVVLIMSPHLPVIGVTSHGATSWINVGMQLQPGEFAKVTVILLDASLMARYGANLDDPREYMKVLGIMAIPFLCIMTQPDLGTGLVYLFIDAVALVIGGAKTRYLLITLAVCVMLVAVMFGIDELIKNSTGEYKLLKQYQRNRLLVFLDPEADTSGSGYNLQQAMIAIGSGGLFGKGYMNATQSSLGFVPESATDFIFCVLAEQFGFFGSLLLLALYLALIFICISIARNAGDLHGTIIVMCVVGMWLFQILENIGMDIGLMPITGIPLPFMSYGTSFMMVNFILLGVVWSVYAHKGSKQDV